MRGMGPRAAYMIMTAEQRKQRWREGWSFLAGLSFWAFAGGLVAYALGNPSLGNTLMWGLPACAATLGASCL